MKAIVSSRRVPYLAGGIVFIVVLAVLVGVVGCHVMVPVEPEYMPMIAAGYGHTVGLKSDGTVVAVGVSDDAHFMGSGQCEVGDWTDIVQVAAGGSHTVGLKYDGTVVAAGDNKYGQCNVEGWTHIVQVAAGRYHTVGLKSDGTAVAVGVPERNPDWGAGQCEVGDWTDIVQIAAGGFHTVGLKSAGDKQTHRPQWPFPTGSDNVVAVGRNEDGQCEVGGWRGVVQIAAGVAHTVGLKSDGTVVCAGPPEGWHRYEGQCEVSDWSGIVQIAAGDYHTLGVKADGTVVAVGLNDHGQCDVGGWTDIVQVSAGLFHTVGLRSDGTVVAVGWDSWGQCKVDDWNLGATGP